MTKKVKVEIIGEDTLKVPLARKGKWKHDKYGVVSFDDTDFEKSIFNYQNNILGFEPYITFGHLNDTDPSATDAELKKGDLSALYVEDDVFYGNFKSKPEAIALVANNDYEYSSAEFVRNLTNKVSGENMGTAFHRVALTNSPFIPFNDNSVLYEKLSIDSSQNVTPFVIKLSINNKIGNPMPEEIIPTQEIDLESQQVKVPIIEEPKVVNQTQSYSIDPEALLASISKLQDTYTTAIQKAEDTIVSLNREIEALKSRITAQEQVSQAFSNSVTEAERKVIYEDMSKDGVAPAVIQAFSQVIGSLDNNSVIKLSIGEETKELSIVDSIVEMLKRASELGKVEYQQYGQSSISTQAPDTSAFASIIKKNRELAEKRLVK